MPGVRGIFWTGDHEYLNAGFVETLQSVDDRDAGSQAAILLAERVAGQQHEVDALIDRDFHQPFQRLHRRVNDQRPGLVGHRADIADLMIDQQSGCVNKLQSFKRHQATPFASGDDHFPIQNERRRTSRLSKKTSSAAQLTPARDESAKV